MAFLKGAGKSWHNSWLPPGYSASEPGGKQAGPRWRSVAFLFPRTDRIGL